MSVNSRASCSAALVRAVSVSFTRLRSESWNDLNRCSLSFFIAVARSTAANADSATSSDVVA
eukprot:30980-Pelagococcus_subviridis.AAC.36